MKWNPLDNKLVFPKLDIPEMWKMSHKFGMPMWEAAKQLLWKLTEIPSCQHESVSYQQINSADELSFFSLCFVLFFFYHAFISIHSSNGDACVHKLPLVPGPPAPVLDQVPGVGVAAAGHGHPPDRRLLSPLPELWYGRPSALQPELPGLCARCRQHRAHPLPQHHGAQVVRYVRWQVGASEGGLWLAEREAELSGLDWAEPR